MRVVTGHRAKELTHPFFLLDEFKAQYKQEPDAWAAVCGYKGFDGYLVYIDAENDKIADCAREKMAKRFGDNYREEFGSKGAHFPIILTDEPVEKRTEFFNGGKETTSENMVMEVLTDWLCILPGSKHRKTGKEYTLKHQGTVPKMKKQELSVLLNEIESEKKLSHRQKKANPPSTPDEELAEMKVRFTFFDLNLKQGLQSCPLPGHKNFDASPSLSVSQDGRVANCFSVHGGMDVFKFVQLRDNCGFPTSKNIIKKMLPPNELAQFTSVALTQKNENAQLTQLTQIPIFLDGESTKGKVSAINAASAPLKGVALVRLRKFLEDGKKQTTKWVLPGFVPEKSICMMAAKRASMKTFMALYFGLSASTGSKNVLGQPEPCKVVYLDYENGDFELYRRVRGLCSDEKELGLASENFLISIYPEINLKRQTGCRALIDMINVSGAKLVIIDTQRRLSDGDENDSKTSNELLTGLQDAQVATGCSFLLLHHMRKSAGGQKGQVVEDEMDEIRGSSDIPASCSVIYYLKRQGTSDKFTLKQLKNRFAPERKTIQLHIEGQAPDKVMIVSDGEVEDAVASENALVGVIWDWLVQERRFAVTTQEINIAFIGAPPHRYSKRSVTDAISVLKANGKIEQDGKRGHFRMVLPKKQKKILEEHLPLGEVEDEKED